MKLDPYQLSDKVWDINIEAAHIAREAAGNDKFVLGSIGPTGKILIVGEVSTKQVYDIYYEQCIALQEGGVDAIIIETMSALDEAQLAIQAVKENTTLPVICTFTFEKTLNNNYRSMMGVSPVEMVSKLINAGVDVIGTNCGNGFDGMIDIAKEIRESYADLPLIVQANAGLPQLINGKNVFPEGPKEMAAKIPQLIDLGVNIIGGCCGTTPEHIAEFSKIIHA